jgi:excisionase family DNA binding protein
VIQKRPNNLNNPIGTNGENCSVCRDLLTNLERFYAMLEAARNFSDWLTVDEVAKELKISKSIVYRIIRKGELKAVDLTDGTEKIVQRGHYRIRRSNLNQYLEKKQVKPLPNLPEHTKQSHRLPKVKNHLGL